MTTDTNTMISITEANQNFSKEITDKKQTIDFSTITACGECCIACPKKQTGICKGCIEADGYVPEWKESGRCKVHECTRQHNVPFCGICDEFPCEQLTSIIHWNPNIEEHMDMLAKRVFQTEKPIIIKITIGIDGGISLKKAVFYYNNPSAPEPNKPNLIGSTVLIEYNKGLLLEHRADSERWAIIGGSLHANESLVDCAVREIREETSINLDKDMLDLFKIYDDPSIIISYPDGNIYRSIMVVYYVKLSEQPNLVISEESRELRFFSKAELKNIKIVETHIPIMQDYLKSSKRRITT